jgi:hypothetical protein
MESPKNLPKHEDLSALVTSAASAWAEVLTAAGGLSPAAREALRATALLILAAVEDGIQSQAHQVTHAEEPAAAPPATSVPAVAENGFAKGVVVDTPSGKAPPALTAEPPPSATGLQELIARFSGSGVAPRVTTPKEPLAIEPSHSSPPLSLLARRADLSARACDWAIRRHDNIEDFNAVKPEYNALREEAGTMQPLFLWMIDRGTTRIGRDDWVVLSGCYHNMAKAAQLAASFNDGVDAPLDAVRLLAEAQSMVLSALGMVGVPRDAVQTALFEWCLNHAQRGNEIVPHLSLADMANPALWGGLRARIDAASERFEAERSKEKSQKKHLSTIRYHATQVQEDEGSDHANDWGRIQTATRLFLEAGGKPSDPRLVDLLLPLADMIPDDLVVGSAELRQVLPFIDQRIAGEDRREPVADRDRTPSPELLEARELLRGKVVLLIGGEAREPARKLLEQELELKELRWLSSREHQSISTFMPDIRRSETALVLLAIRWASHSFEEVQETCNKFDKPYVRLPGGYGANRVAYEIVRQQGERLHRS